MSMGHWDSGKARMPECTPPAEARNGAGPQRCATALPGSHLYLMCDDVQTEMKPLYY
jgi:hypothetical protein